MRCAVSDRATRRRSPRWPRFQVVGFSRAGTTAPGAGDGLDVGAAGRRDAARERNVARGAREWAWQDLEAETG